MTTVCNGGLYLTKFMIKKRHDMGEVDDGDLSVKILVKEGQVQIQIQIQM